MVWFFFLTPPNFQSLSLFTSFWPFWVSYLVTDNNSESVIFLVGSHADFVLLSLSRKCYVVKCISMTRYGMSFKYVLFFNYALLICMEQVNNTENPAIRGLYNLGSTDKHGTGIT